MNLEVKDGIVMSGKVYSDCLWPELIELLNEEMKDFRMSKEGV